MRVLILGTTALALSAGAASAQSYVAPDYGYGPGYSGYGYTAPGPFSDYASQPYGYAAPGYSYDYMPPGSWARGYWGRRYGYGSQY